jgi:type IV pilus assembly protein PilB
MSRKKLGELLIESGLLTPEQLRIALGDQGRWPSPLGVKLIKMGLVSETDLLVTLSEQLGAPAAQLDGRRIPDELISLVSLEQAERYSCIPLFMRTGGHRKELFLGMSDPLDLAAVDELGFRLGCQIRPVLVLHGQLVDAIDRHYRRKPARGEVLANTLEAFVPEIPLAEEARPQDEAEKHEQPATWESSNPAHEVVFRPARATDCEPPSTDAAILRALIDRLVERGVLGPHELMERLASRGRKPTG